MNKETKSTLVQLSEIITEQSSELSMLRKRVAALEIRPEIPALVFEQTKVENEELHNTLFEIGKRIKECQECISKKRTRAECIELTLTLCSMIEEVIHDRTTNE